MAPRLAQWLRLERSSTERDPDVAFLVQPVDGLGGRSRFLTRRASQCGGILSSPLPVRHSWPFIVSSFSGLGTRKGPPPPRRLSGHSCLLSVAFVTQGRKKRCAGGGFDRRAPLAGRLPRQPPPCSSSLASAPYGCSARRRWVPGPETAPRFRKGTRVEHAGSATAWRVTSRPGGSVAIY